MKEETRYLWISQLPPNVTNQSLTDLFSSYGRVLNTKIHEAGNLRGAVLSFLDTKTAAKACAASHLLNGQSLASEYCDQSGEPGLQKLKDSANGKCSERPKSYSRHDSNRGWCRALKLWNFPDRSSDSSIQNGLYHELKRIGKVFDVQVKHDRDSRHAVVRFKRSEDAEEAYETIRNRKSFLGMTLNVEKIEGTYLEDGSETASVCDSGNGIDEYCNRASRVLQVSNIDRSMTENDLRQFFGRYGSVLDIDIKVSGGNQSGSALLYANVQFSDIRSVVNALRRQDAAQIRGQRLKLSFGRSQPTKCIWLANLADSVNDSFLTKNFASHGTVHEVCINFQKHRALVFYQEIEDAQRAFCEMKNRCIAGKRLQIDFASQLCQKHFLNEMVSSGQYPSKCRSNYKIFEQLFPPEFHRGLIPNRKAAARYHKMMLEYMKANHRSLGKYRDHHYDSDREHSRRHDELSPYSDYGHHDDHRSHSKSNRRGPTSPAVSQRSRNRELYSKSRSPQHHQHRQSADSSTSSSPIRSAVCQADLRSLIERSKSSNRSCTQRSLGDSNRRRGSSSDSVGSSDVEAASQAAKDKSLKKLEQQKQMLLAQLANLDAMPSETNSSAANSDAENSRVTKIIEKKQQDHQRSGKGGSAESSSAHERSQSHEANLEKQQSIFKSVSETSDEPHQHQEPNIPSSRVSHQSKDQSEVQSSNCSATKLKSATYDLDAKIRQIRQESSDPSQQQELTQLRKHIDQHTNKSQMQASNGPVSMLDPRLHFANELKHAEQSQSCKVSPSNESAAPSGKMQKESAEPPSNSAAAKKAYSHKQSAAEIAELNQERELEERIKAIDAKLMPPHHQQQQQPLNSPSARESSNSISSGSAVASNQAATPLVDYSKYRIRKRNDALSVSTTMSAAFHTTTGSVSHTGSSTVTASPTTPVSGTMHSGVNSLNSAPKVSIPDTSDFVKSMLFEKSSVFEQDAKRLEQTTASYDTSAKQHSHSVGNASASAPLKSGSYFNYPTASLFSSSSVLSPVPQLQLTSSPVANCVLASPPPSSNPARSILKSPTTPTPVAPSKSPNATSATSMCSPKTQVSVASKSPTTPVSSASMKLSTPSGTTSSAGGSKQLITPPLISIGSSKPANLQKALSPIASVTPKASSASFVLNQNVAKRRHPDATTQSDAKRQKLLSRQQSHQQVQRNSAMDTLFKPDNQYNQQMKKKALSEKAKALSKHTAASATQKSKQKSENNEDSVKKKLTVDTEPIPKLNKVEKEAKKVKQQQNNESPDPNATKQPRESDLFWQPIHGETVKREKLSRSEELFDKIKADRSGISKDSADKESKEKKFKEIKAGKLEGKEQRKKRKESASDQLLKHSKTKQSVESIFRGSKKKLSKSISVESPEGANSMRESEKAKAKGDRRKSSLISSSDEDEWKPTSVTNRSTGSASWELEYLGFQPYESMYDKIKRRQAKRTVKSGSESRNSKLKGKFSDDPIKMKQRRLKAGIKSSSTSDTDADDDEVVDREQHHLQSTGNKSFLANTSGFRQDTSDSSDVEVSITAHSPRTSNNAYTFFSKKSKLADSCNEADDEEELESRRKVCQKIKDKDTQSKRIKSAAFSNCSKSKISVDSVFGQHSDSGASDDTDMQYSPTQEDVKTPTTIEMTDESQAESVSEAESLEEHSVQTKATRLTDIFAEAKAQLDPRSVTEKSLFDFQDDGFEPAPDLPTIDKIQPEENTPESSPDHRDDDEPPNLSADSGDSVNSENAPIAGGSTSANSEKLSTSSKKDFKQETPHHTQYQQETKSPSQSLLHSPTLKPNKQLPIVANSTTISPGCHPATQQQMVRNDLAVKPQAPTSAATSQHQPALRPLIPPPLPTQSSVAARTTSSTASGSLGSTESTVNTGLPKENFPSVKTGLSATQRQVSPKDQPQKNFQTHQKVNQEKQLLISQKNPVINIGNKIAQPPVAAPDALIKQQQQLQPSLVKPPATSPTAYGQALGLSVGHSTSFEHELKDSMHATAIHESLDKNIPHEQQQQFGEKPNNWERKLETTFNEVLTKDEEQKSLPLAACSTSIAAISDSKPITSSNPNISTAESRIKPTQAAVIHSNASNLMLSKQQYKPTTISLTANLPASKIPQGTPLHPQNEIELPHAQQLQVPSVQLQHKQPQSQQENQIKHPNQLLQQQQNLQQQIKQQEYQHLELQQKQMELQQKQQFEVQQKQMQQHELQLQQQQVQQDLQQQYDLHLKSIKRSMNSMEAIALQHIDEIIQDVTEGRVDLEQYMDREKYRKRYQSGENLNNSLSTPGTACASSTASTPAAGSGVRTPATTPKPNEISMQQQIQQQQLQVHLHQQLQQQHQQQPKQHPPLVLPSLTPKPAEQLLPVSTPAAVSSASGQATGLDIVMQQLPVSTAAAIQQQGQAVPVDHQPTASAAAAAAAAAVGVTPFPPFNSGDNDPNNAAAVLQMHQLAQYMHLIYPQEYLYQYPYMSLYQSQQQTSPAGNNVNNSSKGVSSSNSGGSSNNNSNTSNNNSTSNSCSATGSGQWDALLRKYPVKWHGRMALKNDEAGVQMHFVSGCEQLVKPAMDLATPNDSTHVLRIVQRMRLETAQLEGVQRKMADETEFCMLLAVACGLDASDYRQQTKSLRESFIKYLQEKQAAGIVNVNEPTANGQEQPAFVIHIFPPGQFTTDKLKCYANDLLANLFYQPNSDTPHLLVVITTV